MKSLLVPVNFTDNAANAARYAADLALAIDADVHLLHVMDLGYSFEQMEEKAHGLLNSLRIEMLFRTRGQLAVTTNLRLGDIQSGIEEFCEDLNPFAVVMGAPDTKFHGGVVYDHIARAITQLKYPLLIVPGGATFHAIRKIVLACELPDVESQLPVSVNFLKLLKQYFSCTFDVISVTDKKETGGYEEFKWKETLLSEYPELHILQSPRIEQGVRDYLRNHTVDWLMVFPKKHGLLEFHTSRAKRIATDCPIPVLSVRA